MKCLRLCTLALAVILMAANSFAGERLAGRHQLGLNIGVWSQVTDARTEIGPGGVVTTVKNNGTLGGLSYGYWFTERTSLLLSVGGMSATVHSEIGIFGVSTETAVVAPLLIGVKQALVTDDGQADARPYLFVSVGPYIGSQTTSEIGTTVLTESRSEAAVGGLAGAGADFVLSHRFILNIALGYNLISDFSEPIGGSRNYSGPQASFGFSLLIGSGMQSDS